MSPDPLDLWPAEIVVDPLTPTVILRHQGERLKERTGGLLYGEVVTTEATDRVDREQQLGIEGREERVYLYHRFEIVAPALRYRHQLFVCHHDIALVYPVQMVWLEGMRRHDEMASDQAEFTALVRKCLNSRYTVAVLQSLLARIRETSKPVPA